MIVKLLTEHHLEFLSLKGGCRGSSESTLVKMPHCWKSQALAQMSDNHSNVCHCLIVATESTNCEVFINKSSNGLAINCPPLI